MHMGEIEKAAVIGNGNKADVSSNENASSLIEKQDIIPLDGAKRSAGLIEVWGPFLEETYVGLNYAGSRRFRMESRRYSLCIHVNNYTKYNLERLCFTRTQFYKICT